MLYLHDISMIHHSSAPKKPVSKKKNPMISPYFIPYHPFTKPGSHNIPIKISPYILIKIQMLVKSSNFSILTSPQKNFQQLVGDLCESLHRSRTERRRGEPREPIRWFFTSQEWLKQKKRHIHQRP